MPIPILAALGSAALHGGRFAASKLLPRVAAQAVPRSAANAFIQGAAKTGTQVKPGMRSVYNRAGDFLGTPKVVPKAGGASRIPNPAARRMELQQELDAARAIYSKQAVKSAAGTVAKFGSVGAGIGMAANAIAPDAAETNPQAADSEFMNKVSAFTNAEAVPGYTGADPIAAPPPDVISVNDNTTSASNPRNFRSNIASRDFNYDPFGNVTDISITDRQGGRGGISVKPGGELSDRITRAVEGRGKGTFSVLDQSEGRKATEAFLAEHQANQAAKAEAQRLSDLRRDANRAVNLDQGIGGFLTDKVRRKNARAELDNIAASRLQESKDARADRRAAADRQIDWMDKSEKARLARIKATEDMSANRRDFLLKIADANKKDPAALMAKVGQRIPLLNKLLAQEAAENGVPFTPFTQDLNAMDDGSFAQLINIVLAEDEAASGVSGFLGKIRARSNDPETVGKGTISSQRLRQQTE